MQCTPPSKYGRRALLMAAHLAARDVLNYRSRRKSAHILHFIVFEAYREGAFGVRLPTIDDDNVSEIVNPTYYYY